MKLALAQINTTVGDFAGNFRKIAEAVKKARLAGAELIAFPELAITGYPPRDLVENSDFVEQNLRALDQVAALAQGIVIVVGYVARLEGRGQLANAAAICQRGKVVQHYHKRLVPNYDVFDEVRHFAAGKEVGIFQLNREKIGISICEDAWNDSFFWEQRRYELDPIEEQAKAVATLFLNISASPFVRRMGDLRRSMLQSLARRYRVPFAYVNLVGANDELIFDGKSLVINDRGEVSAEGKGFAEDLILVDTDATPAQMPQFDDEIADISQALIVGIRDYVRKCGFKKVVLGLSGGIDSSLVALLAVRALGAKQVLGVAMPSPYSSPDSLQDARQLARHLGIKFQVFPIKTLYQSYRRLLKSKPTPDLADENIQARIRGNLLMALSNRHGYLVLSTGNKSELSVGYCTLYGDMSGGLAAISDLPKTVVYEVARHLDRKLDAIPERIFTKAPTAELRPNQCDQDTLPPYEILDGILRARIEDLKSEAEIIAEGFSPAIVRKVLRLVSSNEYKRRQSAPGLKVTSKAFGMGRRYPIARKI